MDGMTVNSNRMVGTNSQYKIYIRPSLKPTTEISPLFLKSQTIPNTPTCTVRMAVSGCTVRERHRMSYGFPCSYRCLENAICTGMKAFFASIDFRRFPEVSIHHTCQRYMPDHGGAVSVLPLF